MRLIALMSLAAFAPFGLVAETPPAPVQDALNAAVADCAAFENGTLTTTGAAYPVDLTGDGRGWVVDAHKFVCSSAASLFCGTGGCMVTFVVDGHATRVLSKGWQLSEFGTFTVILNQVHGSECGGINPTPCVEALVWDDTETRLRSPSLP